MDPVGLVNRGVNSALDLRDRAVARLKQTNPELFGSDDPEVQEALAQTIKISMKAIELNDADAESNPVIRRGRQMLAERPESILDVRPSNIPLHGLNPVTRALPDPSVGNVLDFAGLGPETLEEDPAGFAAALAATAASGPASGRATARALQMIPRPKGIPPSFLSEKTARRGMQVLRPAAAAGLAGGTVSAVEQMNAVPDISVQNGRGGAVSRFANAINEGKKQFIFESLGGVVGVLGRAGVRRLTRFAAGDQEFFEDAIRSLREAGVRQSEISLMEVTDRALFSSAGRTIGVIPIPVLSKRFRKQSRRKAEALERVRGEMIRDVSPRYRLIQEMYERDAEGARVLFGKAKEDFFRGVSRAAERYRTVRGGVHAGLTAALDREAAGITSDAANVRAVAAAHLASSKRGARGEGVPRITTAERVNTGLVDERGRAIERTQNVSREVRKFDVEDTELQNVVADIKKMDANPSLAQLINVRDNITRRLDLDDPNKPLSKSDAAMAFELGAALDQDIENAVKRAGSAGLQHLYRRLKTLDGDWITLLSAHVGRRTKRVQTTFGQQRLSEATGESVGIGAGERGMQRAQGVRDMEEFLDDMLANASPEEIREFRVLFGDENLHLLRFAAARQIDRMLEAGRKEVTDADIPVYLERQITRAIEGNEGPLGKKALRFWSLVRESGAEPKRVERFMRAARTAWRNLPADSNQFLMRNLILNRGDLGATFEKAMGAGLLGGAGGAATAGGFFGGGIGAAAASIASVFAVERFTHIVTNPRALRSMLVLLDPKTGDGVKARAFDRLTANIVFREWFDEQRRAENVAPVTDTLNGTIDFVNQLSLPDPAGDLSRSAESGPNLFPRDE